MNNMQNQTEEDFSQYNGDGTNLRQAQLRMLEIVKAVDEVCRRHDIHYWIDAGTLLGAVRHKGFIPWDDDVDIAVMREEYGKLRDCLMKELPVDFVFVDWRSHSLSGYFQ